jgi:hypothetical protein
VILIQVSHGFIVRNFVNTGFAAELARQFQILFVTWPEDVAPLKEYIGALGSVEALPYTPRKIEGRLGAIRRYVMVNPRRSRTINVFSMAMKRDNPLAFRVYRTLNSLFGRWRVVRKLWTAMERALLRTDSIEALLHRYQVTAVLASNYGTEPETIQLLVAARRCHIPSLAIVPSWDNLSSKGVMGAIPDQLVVWNKIMQLEAENLHDFPPDRVSIAGPLQFDVYRRAEAACDRSSLCRELGLDPTKPYIVYGTITPRFFPHNVALVEQVADAIEKGQIRSDLQIVVRLHPQVVDDSNFGERLDQYENLARRHPCVRINIPKVLRWGRLRPADSSDQILLARMLNHAAACLVPGSTLALDAIAAGCPAIGIAYDGPNPEPYETSIRRWYDYDYFRPILASKAVPLADSREALIRYINGFIENPHQMRSERNALIDEIIGPKSDDIVQRCAQIVRNVTGPLGKSFDRKEHLESSTRTREVSK